MKISEFRIGRTDFPLIKPFKTALREISVVSNYVVELITDSGLKGIGAASPTEVITGDTAESIVGSIQFLCARLIGQDVMDFNRCIALVQDSMVGNSSGKAAVDIALYDLRAKAMGLPLYQLLGGGETAFETDMTISVNEDAEMVKDTREAVSAGFRILKIKVGKSPAEDEEKIRQVFKAAGDGVRLRIDANQGWTAKEAVAIMKNLEHSNIPIELLEQPVPHWDMEGLRYVRERINTLVMADESVFSPRDALRLIRETACDALNIKLMKCGGITGALGILKIAEAAGIPCMIGSMMEGPIGVSAAAAIACSFKGVRFVDLDVPLMAAKTTIEGGVRYEGRTGFLSSQPGLGIESSGQIEWT